MDSQVDFEARIKELEKKVRVLESERRYRYFEDYLRRINSEISLLAFGSDEEGVYTSICVGIGEYYNDAFLVQIDISILDNGVFLLSEEDKTNEDKMEYIPEFIDKYLKTHCYGKTFNHNDLEEVLDVIFRMVEKERGYKYETRKINI